MGTKTIGAFALAAIAGAIAGALNLLSIEHLRALTAEACFVIGAFAAVSAGLLGAAWRPELRSRSALRLRGGVPVIDDSAPARVELPAVVQRLLLAFVFACIGLTAFGNSATAKLTALPGQVGGAAFYEYCPDEVQDEVQDEPEVIEEAPMDPGCALVKRAFELGYRKSLGDCAPRTLAKKAEAIAAVNAPCTLRQHDEPLLHYAWRLFSGNTSSADPIDSIAQSIEEFDTQLGYLDTLWSQQTHAVNASPHAAHHLWTNLPNPDPSAGGLLSVFSNKNCTGQYDDIVPRPVWHLEHEPASAMVEHVFAQLIFNPLFGQTPGNCREYTIHWNTQNDACMELTENPAAFLDKHDVLDSVRDVLDRHLQLGELHQLALDLGRDPLFDPPPPARAFVSFQCFIIDPDGTGAITATDVTLDGVELATREIRRPELEANGASHLQVYKQMASLFAGGGYNGPVVTNVAPPSAERPPVSEDLDGEAFAFTRLERIRDADPFLGFEWALDREDLIEVYPMHRHLDSFIRAFRQRYWAQRGRL